MLISQLSRHTSALKPSVLTSMLLLLCALYAAQAAHAQGRNATETYAITNARIVTVAGANIERGTIVIRDGLIERVGASVQPPADARIIDGSGLSVYPGFIDALSNLGTPAPPPPQTATPGAPLFLTVGTTPGAPSAPNSLNPVGLQPELEAANVIRAADTNMETWRNAGFTSALTAPRTGIFIGQSAFIQLAGDAPQAMILRAPVALHVGFTPLGFGTYPNSLMGVFAALRQALIDARRYEEANRIYERDPRGLRRPAQDRSLAALLPFLNGQSPVVMNANTEREINRALDLANEFKLKVIIAGAAESYKTVDRLRGQNVPVLLSLNYPKRLTASVPEADPESLRVLRLRVQAPRTAAQLLNAGVRVAFQSGGMTSIADFVTNAQKSVEQGLSRDAALRAMTLAPAEIFGLNNRIGSIETGKIANLTVTRGDVFSKGSTVAHVFIDGRQIELKPATPPAGGATAAGAPTGLSGAWTFNVKAEQLPEINFQINFQQQGENVTGQLSGELGSSQIANARFNQQTGALSFTAPVTLRGQTTEVSFSGTVAGNQMNGSAEAVGVGQAAFTASKIGAPASPTPPPQTQPPSTQPPSAQQPPAQRPPQEQPQQQTPQTNQPQDVPRTNTPPNEGRDRPPQQQTTPASPTVPPTTPPKQSRK